MEERHKRCKSQCSAKYRSRSLSQVTGRVCTSIMQGLVVVGLIVEDILNVDVKCVKGTGAKNIGQGHRVKILAESVHIGEAQCKVWLLEVLHLRRSGTLMYIMPKSLQPKYSQGQQVKVSAESVH